MKRRLLLAGLVAAAGLIVCAAVAARQAGGEASPIYGVRIPAGYRDWTMISVARLGAPVNDLRVKLGNDIAIKAYRDGVRPFPDGTIIARLAYRIGVSEEANTAFRIAAAQRGASPEETAKLLSESVVAGAPINVQFMVKDARRYAASGGWGFGEFTDGKASGEATIRTCFACHAPAKADDFVFTRYAP